MIRVGGDCQVVVMAAAIGDRKGVRYLSNGLKVRE